MRKLVFFAVFLVVAAMLPAQPISNDELVKELQSISRTFHNGLDELSQGLNEVKQGQAESKAGLAQSKVDLSALTTSFDDYKKATGTQIRRLRTGLIVTIVVVALYEGGKAVVSAMRGP